MQNFKLKEVDYVSDLKELMYYVSEKYGDEDAVCFKDEHGVSTRSFLDLANDVAAFATALHDKGFKNKNFALVGEASYDWIVASIGIILSGNVSVPVDKELSDGEILNIIKDSDSCGVVYSKQYERTIAKIHDDSLFRIFISDGEGENGVHTTEDLVVSGYELICRGDTYFYEYTPKKDDTAMIFFTSGTTGKAKGIMLTQENLVQVPMGALNILELPKKTMLVLPLSHSYGFSVGILTTLYNGASICINDSLRNFASDLALYKPTLMYVVPLFVAMMYRKVWEYAKATGKEEELKAKIKESNKLMEEGIDKRSEMFAEYHALFGGNLELIISGGAPLSAELMKNFREIGIPVLNGYGITECSPLVSVNANNYYKDGSIGIPIGCCEIDVRNLDETGHGEIWVKGANVMKGYYKNEAATAEVMDENGYFNTGDIGIMDGDFLFITGRAKNLIILSNGKNVYPEELEDEVAKLPGVGEVVVYAKDYDDERKEKITAQIYPAEGFDFGDADKRDFFKKQMESINRNLPIFKQIREIEIRDIPFAKTSTKKIKRSSLKKF